MEEPVARQVDLSADRIVTKSLIANIVSNGSTIRILRSGVHGTLPHCEDVIRQACRKDIIAKEIKIILPSPANEDVVERAVSSGRNPQEVLIRLEDWLDRFAQASLDLAPKHRLEIRTTEKPHRYHAFFSEMEGIVGIAWHHKASLTTTSFDIGPASDCRKWVIGNLIDDFEWLWDRSRPYQKGDFKTLKEAGAVATQMNSILSDFGRGRIPKIVAALQFIGRAFPDAHGNGATKEHLATKFGGDANDWNKRLLEMEIAGFVRKLGCGGTSRERFGRLLTSVGELIRRQTEYGHGGLEAGR
jgi:hypothetical protein